MRAACVGHCEHVERHGEQGHAKGIGFQWVLTLLSSGLNTEAFGLNGPDTFLNFRCFVYNFKQFVPFGLCLQHVLGSRRQRWAGFNLSDG